MGRHISGDLEHKFWFGVQSSNDADFFGVIGNEVTSLVDEDNPEEGEYTELEYHFDIHDLPAVEEGIAKCRAFLGTNEKALNKFFEENNGYNDKMLEEAGFKLREVPRLLGWYARLRLGLKIKKCLNDNGQCSFEAEL